MENYNITIIGEHYKKGLVYGKVNDMEWFAQVNKVESENGINPDCLKSNQGRVMKLCVYKDIIEEEGDPFKLVFKTSRYIYAEYDCKWEVFNMKYYSLIYNLVNYLEKRYSLKVIDGKGN